MTGYDTSKSANVTFTVTTGSPCTFTGTQCIDNIEYVCTDGVQTADGNTCQSGVSNDLIILGAVAGLAVVGLALIVSGARKV
jgi:hypothetical protein